MGEASLHKGITFPSLSRSHRFLQEMEELARRGPKMPNLRAIADGWSRRGRGAYRPRNQYEFRDGPRLVSIDTTEDNWVRVIVILKLKSYRKTLITK